MEQERVQNTSGVLGEGGVKEKMLELFHTLRVNFSNNQLEKCQNCAFVHSPNKKVPSNPVLPTLLLCKHIYLPVLRIISRPGSEYIYMGLCWLKNKCNIKSYNFF